MSRASTAGAGVAAVPWPVRQPEVVMMRPAQSTATRPDGWRRVAVVDPRGTATRMQCERSRNVPCANGLSVVEGSRWGELRLDGAEMLQQRVELGNVLGQRPLLALHLRDQHFELEYFDREAPGQVVLLAHRPRLGG